MGITVMRRPRSVSVFEDIETGVVVGDVEYPVAIYEDVAGLNLLLAGWTWIEHLLRSWWHIKRRLLRLELIANVEDAHTSVLVRGEDQLGALERAWPVLMQVVRAE